MKKLTFITCFCLILSMFFSVNAHAKEGIYGAKDISYWNRFSSYIIYDRLNDSEKQLYNNLKQEANRFLTTNVDANVEETEFIDENKQPYTKTVYTTNVVPYSGLSSDRAMEIYIFFCNANPQFYFLNSYILFTSKNIYPVIYDRYANGNSRASYTERFAEKVDSWLSEVNAAPSVYEKETAIISALCRDLSYAEGDLNPHQSTATAIFDGKTVCAGYAECFTMLCSAIGIPNFINTSAEHEWASVKLGNNWYNVDVANVDSVSGNYRWKYANKSEATFKGLHETFYVVEDVYSSMGLPQRLYDYGAEPSISENTIYRAFNRVDGDHIYSMSIDEINALIARGQWEEEASPGLSTPGGVPVYGLKNKLSGAHLYTSDVRECKALAAGEWTYENGGQPIFYGSKTPTRKAVYRLFNQMTTMPKATHHYTNDLREIKALTENGYQVDNKDKPMYYLTDTEVK